MTENDFWREEKKMWKFQLGKEGFLQFSIYQESTLYQVKTDSRPLVFLLHLGSRQPHDYTIQCKDR